MDDTQDSPIASPAGMGGAPAPVQTQDDPQLTATIPQQQAPAPPTPQQQAQMAQVAHDSAFGRMAKAILGQQNQYSVDPQTGTLKNNPVPQAPGSLFKTILGAALLGGAAGANGNPAQGFAGGFARGGAAGVQQGQQQDQQARQQAEQQFKDQQAAQQQNREQTLMSAQVAQMHAEQVGRQHTSDLQDAEAHAKHNAASAAVENTLVAAGGTPATIPVNGKGASSFTAPDLVAAVNADPSIMQAPKGMVRHFLDSTDSSELTYNGHQWVDASGEPVNMTDKTTVKAIDVPVDAMKTKLPTSGKDINAAYGGKLVDPSQTYQMAPFDMDALNTKRMSEGKAQAAIDLDKHRVAQGDAELGMRRQELSLKQRELADKENSTGLGPNGQPSVLATSIASGQIPLDRMGYLLAKNPDLLEGVMKVDPTFDGSKAAAYPTVYKDFTSSKNGTAGGTLNAAATAFKHLHELQQLNTYESRIPGTADYQRYQNKVDTVAPELAKTYNDATVPGIEGYKKTLNATFNRDAAIQTQAQSMGDKVDSLTQTWKNAAPSARYEAPVPGMDADAMRARAALDSRYKLGASSPQNGQSTPPAGAVSTGKGNDGKTYYLDAHHQPLGVAQ